MASARASVSQGGATTRIRIQSITVDLSSLPEYPISLKLLLNDQTHQRMPLVPMTIPLHWDNVNPIDAEPLDQFELRIYEHHIFGYRKIRIGAVVFRANQVHHLLTELTVADNTGLVPCSVKFAFPSPETISSIPYSMHKLAAMAVCDKPTLLESMGRTRDVVSMILRLGQQVSELNPIAKVTLGLCNLAWQALEKQDKYDKLVVDLVLGMGDLLPLVSSVKSQAKIGQLESTIIKILRLVEDASRFVIDYQSNGAAVRTVRTFVLSTAQEQVDEFLKQFKRLKEMFDIGMTAQVVLGVGTVLKDTDQDMLMKLITPYAGYNPSAGCLEGTRIQVQNEIQDWVNRDHVSRPIYWISGLAGCGKSTVAHSACQQLDVDNRLAGSFFCKRDNEHLNKPENVVSTLAANLGFQCQSYGAQLVVALRKDPRIATKALLARFEEMIIRPIESTTVDALPQTSFIVLDALDECGATKTRIELVKYLTKLVQLAPWVKVLVTSRPDYRLEPHLKNDVVLYRDLSNDYRTSVSGDIERLIRHRLKELMEDDEMLGSKPWLEDGTVTRLTTQADELFIWAEVACNIICESTSPDRAIHQMLSEETSQGAVTQLHSLYNRILHEALGGVVGGIDVIRSCIAVVVVARIPLTDIDMAKLLEGRVELVELRRVIRRLGSVLYRGDHGTIRVIHQSFSDYMLAEQCMADYRIDKDCENLSLGASCLRIMIDNLKFNICELEDSRLYNREVGDLPDRIQRCIPTYLEYSCVYWVDHLTTAEVLSISSGSYQSTMMHLAQLLKGPPALYWIEVMSLLGKTRDGELALTGLLDWVQDSTLQKSAAELQQFVTDFYQPISESTPHLYISALALGCEVGENLKCLRGEFPNVVKLVQGKSLAKLSNRWSRPIYHHDRVNAVAYSPNGKLLLTACNDGEVRGFNATTGDALFSLSHNKAVNSVAVSPDGRWAVSGSDDNRVLVWDIEACSLAFDPLLGHTDDVRSVAFSPDGRRIASGSFDKTIRVWDLNANPCATLILRHPKSVWSIAFSPNGSHIISGSTDHIVRLWDITCDRSRSPKLLRGGTTSAIAVAFSPDGVHVVSVSHPAVTIWNVLSGMLIHKITHFEIGRSVAFSPDSRYFVCGLYDGSVRVYDVCTGILADDPLFGHYNDVNSVAFSPNGLRIASGSYDRTVLLRDVSAYSTVINPLQGHTEFVAAVACSPDGSLIATGSRDTTVRVWDAHTGSPLIEPITGHSNRVTSVAFSPDSHHIASGSWDRTVRVWDSRTGVAVIDPLHHSNQVSSVTFSPDGRRIVSSESHTVHLWDGERGTSVLDLHEGHPGHAASKVYSPDDQRILSTFECWPEIGSVTVLGWDAHTGALIQSFERKDINDMLSVALSPDGRFLAVGTRHGHLHTWDINTGALIFELMITEGLSKTIVSLVFSPDSQQIAAFIHGGELRVWGTHSGNLVLSPLRIDNRRQGTTVLSFHGQRIISGHCRGNVHVWDISGTGAPKCERPGGFLRAISLASKVPSNQLDCLPGPQGWVRDGDWKLVVWIPFIYRRLWANGSLYTISRELHDHPVSFDFTKFKYGTEWASIRPSDLLNS